ncbi:MAG TPA: glycoside hydrolase family 15 protein [Kofleriaceae bacterium]|nr:glycoside hydrolase family 15 protein [Kofleriaceae bacterium]
MRINDYALIGDGRSAALVSRGGTIDWLCWPRFDSPPIFAKLLDPAAGTWRIAPVGESKVTRRYIDDTNVLETRFETAAGTIIVVDLMAVANEEQKGLVPDHELLRHVCCVRGEVEIDFAIEPRPDFRAVTGVAHRTLGLRWQVGSRLLALRGDRPIDASGCERFTMRAGEGLSFSLTFDEGPTALLPLGSHALDRIRRSIAWWHAWASRANYRGPHRDRVIRSALAIKLMHFAPSGAVIAAPTTSLPEVLGGPDNWDYRFCWLRDASFTARAALSLGYVEDAAAFCTWMLYTTRLTSPELDVIYDVYGNRPPKERALYHLEGFASSRPVRFGNAAASQLQLDMYGEVIDATAQVAQVTGYLDRDTQRLLRMFGDYVCNHWQLPDQGIWEPRGAAMRHTHSQLLCWVALDRLVELGRRGIVANLDLAKLATHRAAIRRDIETNAFDAELGAYTGTLGGRELDASVLLMSWYGFHGPRSPRMSSTYARISERLGAGPGLLYRYDHSIPKREGAFWICSFWAVEHLALGGGTRAEARAMFDAACRYANDVGLMAEEVDPISCEPIGNFPQAYTHVGLISAALSLEERARKSRGEQPMRNTELEVRA